MSRRTLPKRRSISKNPSAVFWGKDIAFFASSLGPLLTEMGVDVVDLTGPYDEGRNPKYPDPFRLRVLERKLRAAAMLCGRVATAIPSVRRGIAKAIEATARVVRALADFCTVFWVACRFDALVLTRQTSISGNRYEFLLHRLLGCRTVLMLHGTEARPPYLNGALFPVDQPIDVSRVRLETEKRWKNLQRAEQGVDLLVGNPGVSHFLTRPVLDRDLLGFPIRVPMAPRLATKPRDVPPTVLHAPSRASAKGTDFVWEILNRLHAEGLRFEIAWSTEWRSHEDVLDSVSTADIVLDQLFADLPGGVLAREAMALGAVPIVGSPVAPWLIQRYQGSGAAMPIVILPEEVEPTLRRLIVNSEERECERVAALNTMRTSQSPDAVAHRWLAVLFGSPDEVYFFDPLEVDMVVHGYAPTEHLRCVTQEFIAAFGPAALRLDHNPMLRCAVLQFAKESTQDAVFSRNAKKQ